MFSLLPREQTLLVTVAILVVAYAAFRHWRDQRREIPVAAVAAPAAQPSTP